MKYAKPVVFALLFLGCAARLCRAAASSNEQLRAREFLVMGYQGLISDLEIGDGPYLRTLMDLLGVGADDRSKVVDQVRSLAKSQPNIMNFADEVLKAVPIGTASAKAEPLPAPSGPTIYSGENLDNALNHLTRGMTVTVYTKGGARYAGSFVEYNAHRLWIQGAARKSFRLDEILAIDAPRL